MTRCPFHAPVIDNAAVTSTGRRVPGARTIAGVSVVEVGAPGLLDDGREICEAAGSCGLLAAILLVTMIASDPSAGFESSAGHIGRPEPGLRFPAESDDGPPAPGAASASSARAYNHAATASPVPLGACRGWTVHSHDRSGSTRPCRARRGSTTTCWAARTTTAVDREAADRLLTVVPDQRDLARANRAFVLRAVQFLAEQGVGRSSTSATGIPTSPSIHEVLHAVDRSSRVVYVDSDPMVKVHNDVLLATRDEVTSIDGDRPPARRDPRPGAPAQLIDFTEPVAVVFAAVLHLVSDAQDPAGVVARVSGSRWCRAATLCCPSSPRTAMRRPWRHSGRSPTAQPCRPTSGPARRSSGSSPASDLLPPGLVDVEQWRPDTDATPTRLKISGGVGRRYS